MKSKSLSCSSAIKLVVASPEMNSGCARTLRMKGMLVLTPRMRVSVKARVNCAEPCG